MDTEKKVMVTGADGFLGSNIVRELLQRGYEVYGFIERGRDPHTLEGLRVQIFHGDLCRPKDLIPLFRECGYVIHTAGLTSMWPGKSPALWRVNYLAVKNLVRLSKKYGIRRFIHIGSATSFGHGPLRNPGNERKPYGGDKFGLDYLDSKFKAQQYLVREAEWYGFPVVILNPTFMIGPYDSGKGSNSLILKIFRRKLPGYSLGGKNYIHVRDVAHAAVNALTLGRLGECYILGNRNLSYREAFRTIAETLDVPPPKFPLPKFLTLAFGIIQDLGSKLTRNPPYITYKMARIGCRKCYYSAEKAIGELKLPQSPIEKAVRESFIWFKTSGHLDRGMGRESSGM